MSLPRSHLGHVLGRVSGRYARVGWVLHGRLISHRVGDKMRVGQVLVNDTIQARSARDKASADSRQTVREYRFLSQSLCYVGYGLTCAFALKGRRSQCAMAHALLGGCPGRSCDLWATHRHITSLAHLRSESDESPSRKLELTGPSLHVLTLRVLSVARAPMCCRQRLPCIARLRLSPGEM